MHELIEAIRAAVGDGATAEQKAAGAQACRTLLAALDAEPGKPLGLAAVPAPSPFAGISPDQALDLLIAKLRSIVPSEADRDDAARRDLRIAFVAPPAPRRRPR